MRREDVPRVGLVFEEGRRVRLVKMSVVDTTDGIVDECVVVTGCGIEILLSLEHSTSRSVFS
jgi:hypothetical protein